jgi:hypothetical protein
MCTAAVYRGPTPGFRQIQQQLRFGVPSVIYTTGAAVEMQLLRPRATDPSIFVARALEPNLPDHVEATFAVEPTHGLYCRRRWKRVMDRQDNNCRQRPLAALAKNPARGPDLDGAVVREPAERGRPAAWRHQSSAQGWDDVGAGRWGGTVVCPGVQRFVNVGADTVILYTLDRTIAIATVVRTRVLALLFGVSQGCGVCVWSAHAGVPFGILLASHIDWHRVSTT